MADAGGIAADRLKSFVERIERLEEEKAAIAGDVKDVYSEAKSTGFDTKIIRKLIALRKMDAQERAEQEQLIEVYAQALGMLIGTPLGDAAIRESVAEIAAMIDERNADVAGGPGGGKRVVERHSPAAA